MYAWHAYAYIQHVYKYKHIQMAHKIHILSTPFLWVVKMKNKNSNNINFIPVKIDISHPRLVDCNWKKATQSIPRKIISTTNVDLSLLR